MTFEPNEEDLKQNIENTLKNMVDVVKTVHRIPNQLKSNNFGEEKVQKLVDIGSIILQSVEYNDLRNEIMEKIRKDFKTSEEYIYENYVKVKEISLELSNFQMPKWTQQKI